MSQLEPDDEICHESMPSASKKLLIFSQESGDLIFLVLLNSDLTNSSNSGS